MQWEDLPLELRQYILWLNKVQSYMRRQAQSGIMDIGWHLRQWLRRTRLANGRLVTRKVRRLR